MYSHLAQPDRKFSKNLFAGLVILIMIFSAAVLLNGSLITRVEAANLVSNPGFETGALSPWGNWNNSVVASNAHTGTYSMQVGTATGSGEQVISGLSPNTAYVLTGWVKTSATSVTGNIGVKNFGGTETFQSSTSTTYTQRTINFTTGAGSTSATIYC